MANYTIIGGDGRQYGPVPTEELRKWIAENRLNAKSLVQQEGTAEWRPLGDFAELADAFGANPPTPPVATPINRAAWADQILARPAELCARDCLAAGFQFFGKNFGFVLGAVLLMFFLNVLIELVPLLGGIVRLLLTGVLSGGLYLACLRRMRGEVAGWANLFDGFKLCFTQLMLGGAVISILNFMAFLLCVVPMIYLAVAWQFALPLIADRRLEFWSAMELSRKVATRVWFPLFGVLLLVSLPILVTLTLAFVRLGSYLLVTARESNFDLSRWLDTLPTYWERFGAASLCWLSLGLFGFLVSRCLTLGVKLRAYENLFGERKS